METKILIKYCCIIFLITKKKDRNGYCWVTNTIGGKSRYPQGKHWIWEFNSGSLETSERKGVGWVPRC